MKIADACKEMSSLEYGLRVSRLSRPNDRTLEDAVLGRVVNVIVQECVTRAHYGQSEVTYSAVYDHDGFCHAEVSHKGGTELVNVFDEPWRTFVANALINEGFTAEWTFDENEKATLTISWGGA